MESFLEGTCLGGVRRGISLSCPFFPCLFYFLFAEVEGEGLRWSFLSFFCQGGRRLQEGTHIERSLPHKLAFFPVHSNKAQPEKTSRLKCRSATSRARRFDTSRDKRTLSLPSHGGSWQHVTLFAISQQFSARRCKLSLC